MTEATAAEFIAMIEKHLGRVLADQVIAHAKLKEQFRVKFSELTHQNKTLKREKAKELQAAAGVA